MKFLLLSFILLFGCSKNIAKNNAENFLGELLGKLISTTEISYTNRHLINSNDEIRNPSNAWQLLFSFKTIKPGTWGEENYCLFYKVPYQEIVREFRRVQNIKKIKHDSNNLGVLKLVSQGDARSCEELFTNTEELILEDIIALTGFFNGLREVTFKIQYIDHEERVKNATWIFPLYNLLPGKVVGEENYLNESYTKNEMNESSVSQTLVPGLRLGSMTKGEVLEQPKNILLGRFEDNYADKTLIPCHELNENCEVIQTFKCDQCRYGWFEVVGGKCPAIKDKFCGINQCGLPGMPACPRGNLYNLFDQTQNCTNDSKAGFCKLGLKTVCDNNLLICL